MQGAFRWFIWTGGFKAVGKTAASAMKVWELCQRYEEAGAFGVEIEVVPPEVTAEISRRTSLFMVSMGAGYGVMTRTLNAAFTGIARLS